MVAKEVLLGCLFVRPSSDLNHKLVLQSHFGRMEKKLLIANSVVILLSRVAGMKMPLSSIYGKKSL